MLLLSPLQVSTYADEGGTIRHFPSAPYSLSPQDLRFLYFSSLFLISKPLSRFVFSYLLTKVKVEVPGVFPATPGDPRSLAPCQRPVPPLALHQSPSSTLTHAL